MLNRIQKRDSKGFTIIEVMIVLAIVGLIMLIIFIAVPALQRNSRNTQRRNDASQIAGAIANFIDNNGGTLPNGVVGGSTTADVLICNTTSGNTEQAKLGYFTASAGGSCGSSSGNISIQNASGSVINPTSPQLPNTDGIHIAIVTGENCNNTNTGPGSLSGRTAAIFYNIENGSSSYAEQCLEQ